MATSLSINPVFFSSGTPMKRNVSSIRVILETFLNVRIGKNKKVPKQFERVIRSRSSGFWQDWFTDEDLKYYGDLFDPFLKQYGYGTVITQRGSKQINPAHGSQYVKKIVNERRQREGLSTI